MNRDCDIDNGDGTGEIDIAKDRESPSERGGRGASGDSRNGDLNVEAVAHSASGDSRDGRAGTRRGGASTGGPEYMQGRSPKMTVTKMTDDKVKKMIARIQEVGDAMTSDLLRTVIAEETYSSGTNSAGGSNFPSRPAPGGLNLFKTAGSRRL